MLKDINRHRMHIVEILKQVYTDIHLSSVLGFKGGTALHLIYGLDRFSVDIDFDLIDNSDPEIIFGKVNKILSTRFVIKDMFNKKNTIFFMAAYDETSKNIKVEINKRKFGSEYESVNYLGLTLKVMVKEDMFSNKLVALYEREGESNRDIFDVNFFLKSGYNLNEKIIFKRTKLKSTDFIRKCINILEKKTNRYILREIGELLTPAKKEWVRENLLKETLFRLKNLELNLKTSM